MSNEISRKEIVEQLRKGIFHQLQSDLVDSLHAEINETKVWLEHASEAIENGKTEKALHALVQKLKQKIEGAASGDNAELTTENKDDEHAIPQWWTQLHEYASGLDKELILQQEEERFFPMPSDGLSLRIMKMTKRGGRAVLKVQHAASNAFRGLTGQDKKAFSEWNQQVPLRNITVFHLLELTRWEQQWQDELKKIQAEILLEIDVWTLHSSGLIQKEQAEAKEANSEQTADQDKETDAYDSVPNLEDVKAFLREAIREAQSLNESYEQKLEVKFEEIESAIKQDISVTGTIERSAGEYEDGYLSEKQKVLGKLLKQNHDTWYEIQQALLNRCLLSMDFIRLHEQVNERIQGFSNAIEDFFANNFEHPAEQLLGTLDEVIEEFDSAEAGSIQEVRQQGEKYKEEMNAHIEQKLLKPANEFIEEAVLSTKLERFTSAIPEWTKELQEKAVLVEELDLTVLPPKFELEKVDWQLLVQRVLNNQITNEFLPKEIKAEQFLSEIRQQLQDTAQIIYTNLEVADEVKKSDEEEPFQVAVEGLQRARKKLDEAIEKIHSKKVDLENKLVHKKDNAFTKLALLLEKQNVNEVRLAGAQYKAKETAVDWKIKFQVQWAEVEEKTELIFRFLWKKLKGYYEVVSKFLGFSEKEKLEGDTTDLATFLSETDERIATLPFIYRRLFDFHKEVEDRFYIRKPDQFDRLKKGYELWQNSFPSTFSIVGEKGSGKSLFIRILMDEILTKHDVIEIDFQDTIWKPVEIVEQIRTALKIDEAETMEDLIAAIQRKRKRIVVILENVQNCFIRNISGFEAIEQLMLLISETNKEILWISSSTRYGWLYLDKVMNVVDYFTHAVETDNLSAQQIEELVLRRHRASGYKLKFLADETAKSSRNYKKHLDDEEKSQEYLKKQYFEKLAKIAEGNPSVAMIYWIRSIKEFDDIYFYINPFDFGAINRIQELDSRDWFALTAFMLHDSLTPEELSLITHQTQRDSKLTVSRLSSNSILTKGDYGYSLNQLLYRQVVRALKEANFIH